ncbi:hypothetical protein [Novipirellula caenicola]|uniref:hypothetical protein n=1 Tax=Novipirellula caenicola TaxID=1536901 RepID=UPI0031F17195
MSPIKPEGGGPQYRRARRGEASDTIGHRVADALLSPSCRPIVATTLTTPPPPSWGHAC